MPGAAGSSLLTMVTWAERLVGDATVTTQPRSIATSNPSRSTKNSRVSAGRSDLMLGTARLTVILGVVLDGHGSGKPSAARLTRGADARRRPDPVVPAARGAADEVAALGAQVRAAADGQTGQDVVLEHGPAARDALVAGVDGEDPARLVVVAAAAGQRVAAHDRAVVGADRDGGRASVGADDVVLDELVARAVGRHDAAGGVVDVVAADDRVALAVELAGVGVGGADQGGAG